MKKRIIKSLVFFLLFSLSITPSFAGYVIIDQNPTVEGADVLVDENTTEESARLYKVTFDNQVTGTKTTKYYEKGYVLGLADVADLSSAPDSNFLTTNGYISWSVNKEGKTQKLSTSDIVVDSDIVIEGREESYSTSNNIMLDYSTNDPSKTRSFENAVPNTLQAVYEESLNAGAEFVGQPDNIIYLTSEAYKMDSLTLKLNAVSAKKSGKHFKDGEYISVTNLTQNEVENQAVGQSINIRLSQDGGENNGYGTEQSDKFVSYNADTTIGLSNPEANKNEFGLANGYQTPYKSDITAGAYTYNESKNTYCVNYCANRIILQNDVVFSGQITIGGITGYYGTNIDWSQTGFQGYINGSYCEIDLNGHDLILTNGSKLISYGSITDSSRFSQTNSYIDSSNKGSLILLPGAELQSPFVIEDESLPISSPVSYFNNNSPFNFYRCPYLDCRTIFYPGSYFRGEYKVDLAGLSDTSLALQGTINFIGSPEDKNADYLLLLDSGRIVRDVEYDANLQSFASNLFNQEIIYSLESANVEFNRWNISFDLSGNHMDFYSDKYQFFIPHYFKVELRNSVVTLNQELIFMTGSYLLVDRSSTLVLSYSDIEEMSQNSFYSKKQEYQSVGGLTFLDTFYWEDIGLPLSDSINGNMFTSNTNYYFSKFWKTISAKPAYCIFDGSLELCDKETIIQYHPFVFGGQMSISNLSSFKHIIKTWNSLHATKVQLYGNYFMMGPNTAKEALFGLFKTPHQSTYYMRGFYTPPLMTHEESPKVLVDVQDNTGTSFVDGTPQSVYNSKTGLTTLRENDSDVYYAFIPDYSWSHTWDETKNKTFGKYTDGYVNFYKSYDLRNTSGNHPDDLAGSFRKVTNHGNYVELHDGTGDNDLTWERNQNIFYKGMFVFVQGGEVNGNSAKTNLYRFIGGLIGDNPREETYDFTFDGVWKRV